MRQAATARRLGMALALACALTGVAVPARAQDAASPIVIGRSYRIASTVMGTARTLNVWLPPGYGQGDRRYPVLYLLDGGVAQDFQHIAALAQLGTIVGTTQDMIVVGIETVDRRNELTPPTQDAKERADFPPAGQAARFRRFVADEVKPWVARRYRTSGDDALMGESLAGLFVVDTLLEQPALFRRYIAVSPSLWWNGMAVAKGAGERLKRVEGERWLWLALANEGEAMGVDRLAATLRTSAPATLHWTYTPMPGETHATIYHPAALAALRVLYAPPAEKN